MQQAEIEISVEVGEEETSGCCLTESYLEGAEEKPGLEHHHPLLQMVPTGVLAAGKTGLNRGGGGCGGCGLVGLDPAVAAVSGQQRQRQGDRSGMNGGCQDQAMRFYDAHSLPLQPEHYCG